MLPPSCQLLLTGIVRIRHSIGSTWMWQEYSIGRSILQYLVVVGTRCGAIEGAFVGGTTLGLYSWGVMGVYLGIGLCSFVPIACSSFGVEGCLFVSTTGD